MTKEAKNIRKIKILKGLEKAYEKMLEFKKEKNSEIVIIRENKIVKIKPQPYILESLAVNLIINTNPQHKLRICLFFSL